MNDTIKIENVSCPFGCKKNDEIIVVGRDLIHDLPGEFTVVKCGTCDLMRTNPRPTQDTIGFYYPDDYAPYLSTIVKQSDKYQPEKKCIRKWLTRFFGANNRHIPKMIPGNLLEIGCGSGGFLMEMQQQGWTVQGIEPSESAAKNAKQQGLNVICGNLENTTFLENKFDMIVAWMAIEHLHHPLSGLEKLKHSLKPEGVIVISVPDMGGLDFRLFKQFYFALQLPAHLYHFTPKTFKQLLIKAGFNKTNFFWHRNPKNLLASFSYVLILKKHYRFGKFIKQLIDRQRWRWFVPIFGYMLALFHQSGRMTVWAYK